MIHQNVPNSGVDDHGLKRAHHVPQVMINSWFLNCDGITLPKLTRLEMEFHADETANLLGICEVGQTYFENLRQRGWYLSQKPDTRAEGIAILVKGRLRNLICA